MNEITLTASQKQHAINIIKNFDPQGVHLDLPCETKDWLYDNHAFCNSRTGRTTVLAFAIAAWLALNPGEECTVIDHSANRFNDSYLIDKVIKIIREKYKYVYNFERNTLRITGEKSAKSATSF